MGYFVKFFSYDVTVFTESIYIHCGMPSQLLSYISFLLLCFVTPEGLNTDYYLNFFKLFPIYIGLMVCTIITSFYCSYNT